MQRAVVRVYIWLLTVNGPFIPVNSPGTRMPTLTLLGRPVLADDGDVIVYGRPVQRHCLALLALLAGERRGLARDRIVAYLWPESDSRTARHRLSVALHVVRQRLGEHGILSHGDALALDAGRWQVDAWSFGDDAARGDFAGALARYHGPLLDGFFLRGTPAFEHWLELWRDRLARRHLALLDALAQEAERSGDLDACVA
ncbi:MAG TPA: hypothetical protein VK939_06925, partial [Longimicrobiales bacterium]|nr:hypothetical protein [Longimicrobiales bacterium]